MRKIAVSCSDCQKVSSFSSRATFAQPVNQ
jgi:hypothetical protein